MQPWIVDDLDALIQVLPPHIQQPLQQQPRAFLKQAQPFAHIVIGRLRLKRQGTKHKRESNSQYLSHERNIGENGANFKVG